MTVRPPADLLTDWANRARALTRLEPHDLASRALIGTYGRALHAHDVGPEVRAALVAQVLDDVSTRRSVWTTSNLGASAVRASKLLRMASPAERSALLDEVTGEGAAACVHLDDNRDPMTRRVGESLFTSSCSARRRCSSTPPRPWAHRTDRRRCSASSSCAPSTTSAPSPRPARGRRGRHHLRPTARRARRTGGLGQDHHPRRADLVLAARHRLGGWAGAAGHCGSGAGRVARRPV